MLTAGDDEGNYYQQARDSMEMAYVDENEIDQWQIESVLFEKYMKDEDELECFGLKEAPKPNCIIL